MQSKPVGTGSIWNVNSWHWENKNYTEVSKKLVEAKLLDMEIRDADVLIKNSSVKFPKAEAQINIRKGKQYLLYEFDLEVNFNAKSRLSIAQNPINEVEVDGSYKVKEINQDDLDEIQVEDIKTNQKSTLGERVKAFLKKNLKPLMQQQFKNFMEDLAKMEADPTKLEEDRKRREEAQLATKKAREEKGEQKERLLQEQKQKQQKMKQEFAKNTK